MIIFNTTTMGTIDLTSAWTYLTDVNELPCQGNISFERGLVICKTKEKKIALNILINIPMFGKVVVRTSISKHNKTPLDLLTSLIQGRIGQILKELDNFKKDNCPPPTQLISKFSVLVKSEISLSNWSKLMNLGEELTLVRAKYLIRARRKQKGFSNFLFGIQSFRLFSDKKIPPIINNHFDMGVAPFYFFNTKPKNSCSTNWKLTRQITNWLIKHNKVVKGHPLVWLHEYANPTWMASMNFHGLKKFLTKHIKDTITKFKNDIQMWDIINEAPAGDANGFNLTVKQLLEITKLSSVEVEKIQPQAHRIINFSEIFGAQSFIHNKPSIPPIHFLKLCQKNNIKFEGIGLQFYMGMKKEFACRELLDISQTIDKFTQFGKSLHFSELGWPSKHDVDSTCFFSSNHPEVAGQWHKPWDEKLQAEFLEKVFTIFASKPKATSITWWDITDKGTNKDIGSKFIPFDGLTRSDLSPKPALDMLIKFKNRIKK